ncbi:MAG: AAA family ATPase, partial [Lachnospiraceae bacterium]
LLGNNGAGKSTVMSAIMEATVEGNGAKEDVDAILVYEYIEGDKGEKLYYYCNRKDIKVIGAEEVAFSPASGYESTPISINTFYYTGHFSPNVNDDIRWSLFGGMYNASDISLLIHDYIEYVSESGFRISDPLMDHLSIHLRQNHYRICQLLINDFADISFHNFEFPKCVILTPNMRGANGLKTRGRINTTVEGEFKGLIGNLSKCDYKILPFIYYGFLNCIYDEICDVPYYTYDDNTNQNKESEYLYGEKLLEDWIKSIRNNNANLTVYSLFEYFVKSKIEDKYKEGLTELFEVVSLIYNNKNFQEKGIFYYRFGEDDSLIAELFQKNDDPLSSKCRFYDFAYSKNVDSNHLTILSSGELAILNLFSRLYDAIVVKPKTFTNLNTPTLLLLDETELGLHPEWQRQYISVLLHFLQSLTNKGKTEKQGEGKANELSFQIVLASHSPILLSDIPRACSNYLCGKNENNNTDIKETFASNIFELYRNSFFMKNGMMGAFAEDKVTDLFKRIQNKRRKMNDKVIKEIETEIEMIGDERIRLYLLHEMEKRIDQRPLDEQIAYYQKKLQELNGKNA